MTGGGDYLFKGAGRSSNYGMLPSLSNWTVVLEVSPPRLLPIVWTRWDSPGGLPLLCANSVNPTPRLRETQEHPQPARKNRGGSLWKRLGCGGVREGR